MRKKELFKRLTAISMAAMMTLTMMPSYAFASDSAFSDGQKTWEEVSAEDAFSDGDVIADEPEEILEDSDDFQLAEPDAAYDEAEDAKTAAAAYLKTNYIDGTNKITSTGGANVVKSDDGLSYTVGLTTPSGSSISSLRLKTERSTSSYRSGWYINSKYVNWGSKKPSAPGSLGITRPTAEEGNQSFTATLRLFAADTSTDVINDATQAEAAALASQDFTITLVAAEKVYDYRLTLKVQDSDQKEITDADVKLEEMSYPFDTVSHESDGTYKMIKDMQYKLTVTRDGYNSYTEKFTFSGNPEKLEKTVTLSKTVIHAITFKVTDKDTGDVIPDVEVTVKKSGDWQPINGKNGSYSLVEGYKYTWSVSGVENYKNASDEFTVTKDEEILIQLTKEISTYKVTFKPTYLGQAVDNATVKVTHEEEDDYDEYETYTVEDKPANGVYSLKKGVEYTYTVKADGYKDATGTYTPSGNQVEIAYPVAMQKDVVIDPADQAKVDAAVAQFNKELGALRPGYDKYKNINAFVEAKLASYTIDTAGIKVAVKSSDNTDVIGVDGVIHYIASQKPASNNINSVSLDVVFTFELNGAQADTDSTRVTVGWDRDHFSRKMAEEKDSLTWDMIKGNNTSQTEVESDLSLPQIMTDGAFYAWSQITWTSSDPTVISVEDATRIDLTKPVKGVVNAPAKDTEVTLTATFNANDTILNSYCGETVNAFTSCTKDFTVTVKGTNIAPPTEEELLAILDKYYTTDQFTDFINKNEVVDLNNCQADFSLPRYTRIKDENDHLVFNNGEITVTSENEAVTVNGYRTYVDGFYTKDITGDLVVTFTRENVTAVKRFPMTVKPLDASVLADELAMMEQAKLHYFDGINDGRYADKDSITGNLHPFQEMVLDENRNPKWIYSFTDRTGKGIIADDFFDDPWIMEGAGYNRFRSTNQRYINHDTLNVYPGETDTEITISSLLSSQRYGVFAKKHPDNEALQKLYRQPVSVTVTVVGTKSAAEGLADLIQSTQEILDAMAEGQEPGQYPAGTKAKLQQALDTAKAAQVKENVTEEELRQAIRELKAAAAEAQDAQNVVTAAITVRLNQTPNQLGQLLSMTVAADTARSYGYEKPEEMKNKVAVVDVLYAIHKELYGTDFENDPGRYLAVNNTGKITTIFKAQNPNVSYLINDKYPMDESGNMTAAHNSVVNTGDQFSIFVYADTTGWTDKYLFFQDVPSSVEAGKDFAVTLKTYGYDSNWNTVELLVAGSTLTLENKATGEKTQAVTDENGSAVIKAEKAGSYRLYVSNAPYTYYAVAMKDIEVKAAEVPATPTEAPKPTVTPAPNPTVAPNPTKAPAKRGQVLVARAKAAKTFVALSWTKVNGAENYKIYGAKNNGKVKLLKAVSGTTRSWTQKKLKKGTTYKYYVAAFDSYGRITKSAVIYTNTTGGKKADIKKVTVNKKAFTLKKGKTATIKAKAIASKGTFKKYTSNIRYVSTNTSVATVSKKGVIKAKAKGKCYVYCYAQNGLYKKVKVTVK